MRKFIAPIVTAFAFAAVAFWATTLTDRPIVTAFALATVAFWATMLTEPKTEAEPGAAVEWDRPWRPRSRMPRASPPSDRLRLTS